MSLLENSHCLLFGGVASFVAGVLRGPNDKHLAVIFGILWGSALGWLQPQHTTAYVPIIPRGQEAELMGIYLFSGQFLSWLPPTVFTVMNELQIPMSYGLGSLSVFFALALLVLSRMGRYEDAIAAAATTTAFCLPFSHGKVADNGNTNNDTTTFNNENDGLMEQEMSCNYKMVTTPPKANGIHIQQPVHKHEFT